MVPLTKVGSDEGCSDAAAWAAAGARRMLEHSFDSSASGPAVLPFHGYVPMTVRTGNGRGAPSGPLVARAAGPVWVASEEAKQMNKCAFCRKCSERSRFKSQSISIQPCKRNILEHWVNQLAIGPYIRGLS